MDIILGISGEYLHSFNSYDSVPNMSTQIKKLLQKYNSNHIKNIGVCDIAMSINVGIYATSKTKSEVISPSIIL